MNHWSSPKVVIRNINVSYRCRFLQLYHDLKTSLGWLYEHDLSAFSHEQHEILTDLKTLLLKQIADILSIKQNAYFREHFVPSLDCCSWSTTEKLFYFWKQTEKEQTMTSDPNPNFITCVTGLSNCQSISTAIHSGLGKEAFQTGNSRHKWGRIFILGWYMYNKISLWSMLSSIYLHIRKIRQHGSQYGCCHYSHFKFSFVVISVVLQDKNLIFTHIIYYI